MKWIDNLIHAIVRLPAGGLRGQRKQGAGKDAGLLGTRQGTPGFHTLGNGRQIHRHPESECQGQNTGNGLPGNRTERLPVHRNGLPHTVHL